MSEKNCAVVLTDAQEVKLLQCDPESETFDIARKVIGCEWIEIVEPESLANDQLVLLIDEEGKLKSGTAYINCIASHLYESEDHGDPIIGSAVIVKAGEEDLQLLTESEACAVCDRMLAQREESIASIAKAFHLMPAVRKKNEMRDEIKNSEIAERPQRQPCEHKEMER